MCALCRERDANACCLLLLLLLALIVVALVDDAMLKSMKHLNLHCVHRTNMYKISHKSIVFDQKKR